MHPKALITLIIITLCSAAHARHFVVAFNGSDAAAGTLAEPWQTFDRATAVLDPGDTLIIREGLYGDPITLSRSGDPITGPIVVLGYPGEQVMISNIDYTGTGISVTGSYIILQNVSVKTWSNAIDITAPAHHVTLNRCLVSYVGFGIAVYDGVHNITVNDCDMRHFGWFGFDATAGGATNLIYNIQLNNCYSHDADYNIPIHNGDMNADGFAFGHNNERDITLTNCHARNTGDGFDLDGHNIRAINCVAEYTHYGAGGGFKCWGDSVWLINCLSHEHLNTGFELDQEENVGDQYYGRPTTTFMIHCTGANSNMANIQVYDTLKKLVMYNTILAGGPRDGGADTASVKALEFDRVSSSGMPENYTGDYNLFQSINGWRYVDLPDHSYGVDPDQSRPFSEWQADSHQDAHSMFRAAYDGIFYEDLNLPRGTDYPLAAGSPAIDAGTPLHSYPTDLHGKTRDNLPDIGCYEGSLSIVRAGVLPESFIAAAWPNPAHDRVTIALPVDADATVTLYDIAGNRVGIIPPSDRRRGESSTEFSVAGLAGGTYLCEIITPTARAMAVIVVAP